MKLPFSSQVNYESENNQVLYNSSAAAWVYEGKPKSLQTLTDCDR